MKKQVIANSVEYAAKGVLHKVVILATNEQAERYAKGDRSIKVVTVQKF